MFTMYCTSIEAPPWHGGCYGLLFITKAEVATIDEDKHEVCYTLVIQFACKPELRSDLLVKHYWICSVYWESSIFFKYIFCIIENISILCREKKLNSNEDNGLK